MEERPTLDSRLSEDEFRRWYWTMAELQPFARRLGVSASGPKAELTARIASRLAGRSGRSPSSARGPRSSALPEPLTPDTVVPVGQRATQQLRTYFEGELGGRFRFDGHMRTFLAAGGVTLGEAADHWRTTRGVELPEQSKSLEFNAFTRAWHAANPGGSSDACRRAWNEFRSLPVDGRPPPSAP